VTGFISREGIAIEPEHLARLCARAAHEVKASAIAVLDLRGISSFADHFVICTGASSPHLRAIVEKVEERLRTGHRRRARAQDGTPESGWIVLDYGQVLVHVFSEEKRAYYTLEDLWSDARRVAFEPE